MLQIESFMYYNDKVLLLLATFEVKDAKDQTRQTGESH